MSPDLQPLLKACFDFTSPLEGNILWPYLDNADTPNVTIGRGHLLYSAQYAANVLELTIEVVEPQWERLKRCKPGLVASAYRGETALRLAAWKSDSLFNGDLWQHILRCKGDIPGFAEFPEAVQVAIIDIDFNVRGGVKTFPAMLKAAAAKDWSAFIRESDRPQLPARSKAVQELLAPLVQSAPIIT